LALAPEPYLSACLEVVYRATINARHLGTTGRRSGITPGDAARLDDLMDAVHNLPRLVRRWETVNEGLIRGMLKDFDDRWSEITSFELLPIYERALLGVEDAS
jgi:hypothetical protein